MVWAMRSRGSRLIFDMELPASSRNPSVPAISSARSALRTSSIPKLPSMRRMKGPMAQDPLLSLPRPSSRALRPSKSRRLTSLPRVAPTSRPRASTTSTTSGSGLLQSEAGCTPMRAPWPSADMGWALVKTSASGPMPTSRYCDQSPRPSSISLALRAASEPGLTAVRSTPSSPISLLRMASAARGSPLVRSSITRSRRLAAKVTPQALIACRSTGASKKGFASSRRGSSLLSMMAAMGPRSRPFAAAAASALAGSASFSSSALKGWLWETSIALPWRTAMTAGPTPGSQTRPSSSARSASRGRTFIVLVIRTSLSAGSDPTPALPEASLILRYRRGAADGGGLRPFRARSPFGRRADASIGEFDAERGPGLDRRRAQHRLAGGIAHEREAAGQHLLIGEALQEPVEPLEPVPEAVQHVAQQPALQPRQGQALAALAQQGAHAGGQALAG